MTHTSITACKECGSTSLTWQTHNRIRLGCPVQQGRLNTNEVECLFVLGCDDCSETLATRSADDVAKLLNDFSARAANPDAARIAWIQKVNTLHRKVEFLYVVDGYEATITWDGIAISEDFHGETVAEAIDKAMAGFDLSAQPKWRPGECPNDRQLTAVEKQRDELLAALELAQTHIGWCWDHLEHMSAMKREGSAVVLNQIAAAITAKPSA